MNEQSGENPRERLKDDCVIPGPIDPQVLPKVTLSEPEHRRRHIKNYIEVEAREKVVHLELIKSERIMGRDYEVWDVHTDINRWWVVTNPTNLYDQQTFPSLDYILSFHVGLMLRVLSHNQNQSNGVQKHRLYPTLSRWEDAAAAANEAHEVEDFQSIGMRLRECLLTLASDLIDHPAVKFEGEKPKRGDFLAISAGIADGLLKGGQNQQRRAFLKNSAKLTWQLVNWLTHARNAAMRDAEVAIEATSSIITASYAALERLESDSPSCCPRCGSYRLYSDYRPELGNDNPYIKLCERCGWCDPPVNSSDEE